MTDTTVFPYSAIAQLYIIYPNVPDRFLCTGWIFASGPEATYAVTAAHCIYDLVPDPDSGQPPATVASAVVVAPGQNINDSTGETITPFGLWAATVDWFHREWEINRNPAYDYAILKLVDRGQLGASTGSFGFMTTQNPVQLLVSTAGYPGDKTPDGAMWKNSGGIAAVTDDFLTYFLDTTPGSSGSPIWVDEPSGVHALGIHTVSFHDPKTGVTISNRGVRITNEVLDILLEYRAQYKIFLPTIRVR